MTVYCVLESDFERNQLQSIWSTKELAEAECDILADRFPLLNLEYYVEDYEVDRMFDD